jgi:hypothetical protein
MTSVPVQVIPTNSAAIKTVWLMPSLKGEPSTVKSWVQAESCRNTSRIRPSTTSVATTLARSR